MLSFHSTGNWNRKGNVMKIVRTRPARNSRHLLHESSAFNDRMTGMSNWILDFGLDFELDL